MDKHLRSLARIVLKKRLFCDIIQKKSGNIGVTKAENENNDIINNTPDENASDSPQK